MSTLNFLLFRVIVVPQPACHFVVMMTPNARGLTFPCWQLANWESNTRGNRVQWGWNREDAHPITWTNSSEQITPEITLTNRIKSTVLKHFYTLLVYETLLIYVLIISKTTYVRLIPWQNGNEQIQKILWGFVLLVMHHGIGYVGVIANVPLICYI